MFEALARSLGALRLNRQFPPWERIAACFRAMTLLPEPRLDPSTALPDGPTWLRLRAEVQEAAPGLERLRALRGLPPAEAERLKQRVNALQQLAALELPPLRHVEVALRHRDEARASWRVIVDRLDLSTATLARYTLIVAGTPGQQISDGDLELRASETLRQDLEVLAAEDAALAFALLRRRGLEVEEVVRGVIGPGWAPGRGPAPLRGLGLSGVGLSAALERASIDVQAGLVDDPLATEAVLPEARSGFGLVASRKWAVEAEDRERLQSWLKERGSRGLVYGG